MKGRKTVWKSILLTVMLLVWTCMAVPVLAEEASGDNSLSSLGITTEGVTVSPDFYYSTIEYQVTVPSGTSRLELDPVTSNSGASILGIDGQDIGSDGTTTVAITVQAANGNQITYYLYVTTDTTTQAAAPAAETETEAVTEAQTEAEPETEDPRYVKVDRNALEEAEKTISTLKTETGNYRDRVTLLTRILYGMIALCVILLFAVINLALKKKDLKAELQNYMGYGYDPGAGEADSGYAAQAGYDNGGYNATQQGYDNSGYDAQAGYDNNGYDAQAGYDNSGYDAQAGYDNSGYDAQTDFEDPFEQQQPLSKKEQKKLKKEKADDDGRSGDCAEAIQSKEKSKADAGVSASAAGTSVSASEGEDIRACGSQYDRSVTVG